MHSPGRLLSEKKTITEMTTFTLDKKILTPDNEDIDLDNCLYSEARKKDKRSFWNFLLSLTLSKIELIALFYSRGDYELLVISLSQYFFAFGVDFFMNALLFSDDYISQRYQNQGNLDFFSSLFLSVLSNIVSYIITYIIVKLTYYSPAFELLSQETNDETIFLKNYKKIIWLIKAKIYLYFFLVFIMSLSFIYFLGVFCNVYNGSQWNWFFNSFQSVGISLLTSIGFSFIISFFRFLGLWIKSEKVYNVSLYLNRN